MSAPGTTGHTISRKLLNVALITTLVALLVAIAAISAYYLRADYRSVQSDLLTESELLGHMTAPALAFHDRALARTNLNLLRLRPEVSQATLYDERGQVFARYVAENVPALPLPIGPEGVRMVGGEMVVYKPIMQDGQVLGTIHMQVRHGLYDRLLGLFGIGLLVTVVAMAVAFLLSRRLHKGVTVPILSIADIARGVVERRDYSRRAAKLSDDEVGLLADSFNDMLSEIETRTRDLEQSNLEIAREVTERTRAQNEVMRLNTELEQRVRERTLQLEASNAQLTDAKASADKANQAKSEFLSSMSHELRTPLNAILGFAQLLDSDDMPVSPAKRHDYLTHILNAGQHLLTLINEVLDLAKVESGSMTLSLEPVSVADVFHECEEMIEPAVEARGLKLAFSQDDDLHVVADRTRLRQVLLNLLSNAVKYNRDGGTVTVSAIPSGTRQVRITVKDSGHGLDARQCALLFQPFNRLGQESGPEEGTGIGLVLTKRLIELMGGAIGVFSEVGVGTTFWIDLHASAGAAMARLDAAVGSISSRMALAADAGEQTLLYVEDNPGNLRLVEEIVALRSDLKVISAPDALLGVSLAQSRQPAVILMDINLPGMSGIEALKLLRRDPRTAHIPVIALTANAMARDVESGMAFGFYRYLTKPIDIPVFLSALEDALALSARHSGFGTLPS